MLRLGDTAPDFEAACHFPDKSSSEKRIKFSDFCADSWVILFSHPADFTPVCTTELARVNLLESEWSARSCKVIGLSTDSVESHSAWSKDICAYVDSICECVRICACGRICVSPCACTSTCTSTCVCARDGYCSCKCDRVCVL